MAMSTNNLLPSRTASILDFQQLIEDLRTQILLKSNQV